MRCGPLLLTTLALTFPLAAFAQPGAQTEPGTKPDAAPAHAERQHRLNWHYPRFRWWEYVAAGAVSVGNISLELLYQDQPPDRWSSPILADARVRSWLRADTLEGRLRADDISDYQWYVSTYYVLLDGIVTPLASDRFNTDVAFQLTLLNWQAIGLSGLVARLTHVSVGRTRPMLQGCSDEPGAAQPCRFEGASFVAGHAMMSAANAGLACANHISLPLYGGGIADQIVCPIMVANALTIGTLRIVADKHWLSDTIPGLLMGGAIGFGMPWLLHYRFARKVASPLPDTALVPWANQESGGVMWVGRL